MMVGISFPCDNFCPVSRIPLKLDICTDIRKILYKKDFI